MNPTKGGTTVRREEVEAFVRAEYWRLTRDGRIPYALPVVPSPPTRPDHREVNPTKGGTT